MTKKRIQLTLFVEKNESNSIEKIREKFNPEQFALINSHVTLCREDELEQIEKIIQKLTTLQHNYITIHFGPVVRFAEGKGVLLPAIKGTEEFQKLREILLQEVMPTPGKQLPHITLMHPRNSTCTDILFEQIQKSKLPCILVFKKIYLIEQQDGNKWELLKVVDLINP